MVKFAMIPKDAITSGEFALKLAGFLASKNWKPCIHPLEALEVVCRSNEDGTVKMPWEVLLGPRCSVCIALEVKPLTMWHQNIAFVGMLKLQLPNLDGLTTPTGSRSLAAMNYQSLCNRLHGIATRLEAGDVDEDILPPLETQKCLNTVAR